MAQHRYFLLLGEAGNHQIQVGDNIDILEAYQRQDLPVALANRFWINGSYLNHGLPRPYVKKLVHADSCSGEIVHLSRDEKDLTVTVDAQ